MGNIRPNCRYYNWINILNNKKGSQINGYPFFYLIFLVVNRHKAHMPINTSIYSKKSISYYFNLITLSKVPKIS